MKKMTKEQLEKIAKYNRKIDEEIKFKRIIVFLKTFLTFSTGGVTITTLASFTPYIKDMESEDYKAFVTIMALLFGFVVGCPAYMAMIDFGKISALRNKYIDAERYQLEEELRNENKQEDKKSL